MRNKVSERPSGQPALAVPVEPASGLAPSGFDQAQRPMGYYWLRWYLNGGHWTLGHWRGDGWEVIGSSICNYRDDEFLEIGAGPLERRPVVLGDEIERAAAAIWHAIGYDTTDGEDWPWERAVQDALTNPASREGGKVNACRKYAMRALEAAREPVEATSK